MHRSEIVRLLKLAYTLDKSGNFRASDKITFKLTKVAQYYGNFMSTSTENRVVPFDDTEEDVEIDAKRLDKQDVFRVPESKDDEASNPELFNIQAQLNGPSGYGITYEDPAPESKNIGLSDNVSRGDLSEFLFKNTYEQNVSDGNGHLNRNPR